MDTRMDERRATLRRESDRELIEKLGLLKHHRDGQNDTKRQRRRAIRHNCKARLSIDIVQKAGNSDTWSSYKDMIKGRVLDLSETGASLYTTIPLNVGQQSRLDIELHDGRLIQALTEVRWMKESKGGYATGLKFTRLSQDHENIIRQFLTELDQTLGL